MKNVFHCVVASTVALLLAAGVSTATAKATQQDVTKARAECAQHKQKVRKMEASAREDDPALTQARRAWERACHHAEVLINEFQGTAPPKVVPPG